MKKIIFLLAIIGLASCTKKDDVTLNIKTSEWYLTRNSYGGGLVNLRIEGSTNGDKVMVSTYGDGVHSERIIELDSRKIFNEDIVVSFSATSVAAEEFEVSTKVTAYKSNDTLIVTLNSGKLKY